MTSQRLIEDLARWLYERDYMRPATMRVPDDYLNEAAVFLAGELGQRLQWGEVEKGQCRAEVQLDESPTLWRCRFPVGHQGNHETLRGVVFRIKGDS